MRPSALMSHVLIFCTAAHFLLPPRVQLPQRRANNSVTAADSRATVPPPPPSLQPLQHKHLQRVRQRWHHRCLDRVRESSRQAAAAASHIHPSIANGTHRSRLISTLAPALPPPCHRPPPLSAYRAGTLMDNSPALNNVQVASQTGTSASNTCRRTIRAPAGQLVKFTLSRLSLSSSQRMVVYDGDGTASPQTLMQASSIYSAVPASPLIGESGLITVLWYSRDTASTATGFQGTWEYIAAASSGICGTSALTADTGTISAVSTTTGSGTGFPGMDCTRTIGTDGTHVGQTLEFAFVQWSQPISSTLRVYNGSGTGDSLVTFTTSTRPTPTTGTIETAVSNVVTLRYTTSNSQAPAAGWALSWRYLAATTSVCNPQTPSTLTYDNGQMMDHTSTSGTGGGTPNCIKTIEAPSNKRIKIVFERMANPSQYQNLYLYDGDATGDNQLSNIGYYGGTAVPAPMIAESGSLTVQWSSSSSSSNSGSAGWKFSWEFVDFDPSDVSVCGETVLTGDTGTISSYLSPSSSDRAVGMYGMDCIRTIGTDGTHVGQTLELTVVRWSQAISSTLRVYNGSGTGDSLVTFTTSTRPSLSGGDVETTVSNVVTLRYTTSNSQAPSSGWELSWRYVASTLSICTGNPAGPLTFSPGTLTDGTSTRGSVNPVRGTCTKVIQSTGCPIVFTLSRFSLGSSQRLTIYDGPTVTTEARLGQLVSSSSGWNSPFTARSGSMTLQYSAYSRSGGTGWQGSWEFSCAIPTLDPTSSPPTNPPTRRPTTRSPTRQPTGRPTTRAPTTRSLTTLSPVTATPVTIAPATATPTTGSPVTSFPTRSPVTYAPITGPPITYAPTTGNSTSNAPVSSAPTTQLPTTRVPTTNAPASGSPVSSFPTRSPVTYAPITGPPITYAPTTGNPTSNAPVTSAPTTQLSTTRTPTANTPATGSPVSSFPTRSPVTYAPITGPPVTRAPTTGNPTSMAPVSSTTTQAPTTRLPTVSLPTDFCGVITCAKLCTDECGWSRARELCVQGTFPFSLALTVSRCGLLCATPNHVSRRAHFSELILSCNVIAMYLRHFRPFLTVSQIASGLTTESSEIGLGVCTDVAPDDPALNTKSDSESSTGGEVVIAIVITVLVLACCFGFIWVVMIRRRNDSARAQVFENPLCENPPFHKRFMSYVLESTPCSPTASPEIVLR